MRQIHQQRRSDLARVNHNQGKVDSALTFAPFDNLHDGGQKEVWKALKQPGTRFCVVAAGRRWGKTYFAADWLIDATLMNESNGKSFEGFDVYYVAPTFQQAKDIMFRLIERLGEGYITKAWPSSLTFEFVNGRVLQLKGADRPDRLRGVGLSHLCCDEYASMRAEVWSYVLRATLADLAPESKALFIGTPDRRNHFYALYQNGVSNVEGWRSFKYYTKDSPLILESEVEDARNTLPDAVFKREYEADFGDSADLVLNPDLVKVESKDKPFGDCVIGVRLKDFAAPEEDEWGQLIASMSSIAVVELRGDRFHVKQITRDVRGARWICTSLFAHQKKYKPQWIAIASDQLNEISDHIEEREERYNVTFPFEEIKDPKSQYVNRCAWILEPLLESGRITFEPGDYLEELRAQMGAFPGCVGGDDMIRALALACSEALYSEDDEDEYEWQPLDEAVGI